MNKWRISEKRGRYVPQEIREKVVYLLNDYSFSDIQNVLSLSSKTLRSWQKIHSKKNQVNDISPLFIELPSLLSKEIIPSIDKICLKISKDSLLIEANLPLMDWYNVIKLIGELR